MLSSDEEIVKQLINARYPKWWMVLGPWIGHSAIWATALVIIVYIVWVLRIH